MQEKKAQLEVAREEAQVKLLSGEVRLADPDVVSKHVNDLRALLEQSSIMEQRAVLRSFVQRVEVTKDEVRVVYVPPVSAALKRNGFTDGDGVLPVIGIGSPRGGKTRTFLRFSVLAKVRFYAKRSPETGYRFLTGGSSREILAALAPESHLQKAERRNPLALAEEWQQLLDTGQVGSRAALARKLGVSRAHVTQTLRLLGPQRSGRHPFVG
ncbi:MAG: hypothetical protein HY681_04975 [Chloroflexi bacterium]|nr:hypothetical protein [Chloroflexota bacterium]